jgi:DNA-binding NarL/FixJ family response regulator
MDAVLTLPRTRGGRPPGTPPQTRRTEEEFQRSPRILIVEDEFLVATEIEAGLSENGFDVVGIATTAAEAIRLAKTERPTLIVMDIRLHGRRDGIEAATEIYETTGIRCLFATAYTEPRMQERAQPAAPLGWLAKPYAIEGLIAAVGTALNQLKQ